MKRENLFLIGFMGAGKSRIAACLKETYGMEILEMDQEIERRAGTSISEIFRKQGEAHFRSMETALLKELASRENLVVSCGGGVPLRQENVEAMRQSGRVVLLLARPETILERVKGNHNRPLLENHMNVAYIEDMMKKRQRPYEQAADVQVETDGRSPEEICRRLMEALGWVKEA